ncbi:hypothetical protein NMY22_g2042 [Coprinellus aureogranulatus]|nr:hypothetical protein NMY22_g2042 [Coprinellus aureogranulatus]
MESGQLVHELEASLIDGAGFDDLPSGMKKAPAIHFSNLYDYSHNDKSVTHYGDVHVTTNYNAGLANTSMNQSLARELLLKHVSHGALHNSAERGFDAPKCYPETRVAVQEEILSWVTHGGKDTNPKKVLWLSGPAGSGKTAIVGSITDRCHAQGLLAASFFFSSFSGSPERSSKIPFIVTLAYQLMQHDPILGLREEVLAALDRDPLILKRNLETQADVLIIAPLRKVYERSVTTRWPKLVLVDGLDECGGNLDDIGSVQISPTSKDDNQREILSILVNASSDPSFPFHVVISSRPEQVIQRYLSSLPEGTVKKIFLDAKYDPEADIKLYLEAMLSKIGRDHGLAEDWHSQAFPDDWPEDLPQHVPSYLAQEASEQFIYAATAIRYIQDGSDSPHGQLKRLLSWKRADSSKPFAALDALYTLILQASPTPLLSAKWLLAIRQMKASSGFEPWGVDVFFVSSPGETEFRLGRLASLIGLMNDKGEIDFAFYHKSLFDFLDDPDRSGGLHVDQSAIYQFINHRYDQILRNRGPQVPLSSARLDKFLDVFCLYLPLVFTSASRCRRDPGDVDWWLTTLEIHYKTGDEVAQMFEAVHQDCHWYRCFPACKVWRNGIVRYCKKKGWRVPTSLERFQDRFPKTRHSYHNASSPLRPPLPYAGSWFAGREPSSRKWYTPWKSDTYIKTTL